MNQNSLHAGKRWLGILLPVLFVGQAAGSACAQQPAAKAGRASGFAAAPWAGLRNGARNAGFSAYKSKSAAKSWTFETLPLSAEISGIYASPALGSDGTVYIGNGRFYALDGATGEKKWQFFADGQPFQGGAALDAEGTLYVGCDDNHLYAIDSKTGAMRWRFKTEARVLSTPAIGADNTLYFGSHDRRLYAVNARTGELKWKAPVAQEIESSPALGANGLVYCQVWGRLYAFDSGTGKSAWTYTAADDLYSNGSPAIGADGTVFACFVRKGPTKHGAAEVKAFGGRNGKAKWTVFLPAYVYASPALGADGTVYVGCGDGKLYALDSRTGRTLWTFATGDYILASPAIGADGTIYIGSYDKKVYAVDGKTGRQKWAFETGGAVQGSPVVNANGTVYVGALDGNFYAIHPPATE